MCDTMLSRDMMTSAAASAKAEETKLLSLDVEHLVSEIKENLRLSGFKSRRHRTHFARSKPYVKPTMCESCNDKRPCRCDDDDTQEANNDPYQMLQALLQEGSLIKEAVRRLQIGLSPKQRYYYESDEESSRSPKFRLC
uniref:GSK-3-binding protein n=1 Tax=Sipha flava TaxID=143950 RepID=A0A2S2QMC9_9HEMI